MNHWYLSFANNKQPGACIVAGKTLSDAIHRAWELGIHPGGSVVALFVPPEEVDSLPLERFIPLDELEHYGEVVNWEELLC